MTGRERIGSIMKREPVDRIGLGESIWGDTARAWRESGSLKEDESIPEHFGYDYAQGGWPNVQADPEYEDEILDETDEWKLVRNSNGAHLKWWKEKSGTPEHVDFEVKDRSGWEEQIRPRLIDDSLIRKRINVDGYKASLAAAHAHDKFFFVNGINVFECMHPACGHEYMLMGMALDPDWVKDMCHVYADLLINCMEILVTEGAMPDGVWFYEDMGFKERPFMSPDMYRDIVWPAHKKTFDWAHSYNLPVMVHSCGFVEPLVPGLIEAGMDGLQAIEVKAGMDLLRLKKQYGDRIALCGGMDIRALESNDLAQVDAELQKKIPAVKQGSGYILHSDHSISSRVGFDTYAYFVKRGLELGAS